MTEELKSNMPAFEEVKAEYTMRMVQVPLRYPLVPKVCTLHMDRVTPTTKRGVWTYLYEIKDPTLAGFCPAKIWSTDGDELVALFYATEAVPPANRAFGKGSTYIAAFRVEPDEVIEYNVDARVSIQQVFDDGGVIYTVSFGQSEYDVIVKETDE